MRKFLPSELKKSTFGARPQEPTKVITENCKVIDDVINGVAKCRGHGIPFFYYAKFLENYLPSVP